MSPTVSTRNFVCYSQIIRGKKNYRENFILQQIQRKIFHNQILLIRGGGGVLLIRGGGVLLIGGGGVLIHQMIYSTRNVLK